jgi:23S rRNA (guanosine2251-2'-O)-methyltransferase
MEDQLIFGRKPILDALTAETRFEKVYVMQGAEGAEIDEIKASAKAQKIIVQEVPKEKIQDLLYKHKLRDVNHQGVMGYASLIAYKTIDEILAIAEQREEHPLIVVLDGVTDIHNFGAIARSAECFGAHGIVMQYSNAAPINAVAIKVSAGALTRLAVCREQSLLTAIKMLRANGLKIYGADTNQDKTISQVDLTEPIAIILGAEGDGIAGVVKRHCDALLAIPMKGNTESLNVSVSAGVVLYEAASQRG